MKNNFVYIEAKQNRNDFTCKSPNITDYLRTMARQHHSRNLSKTYVNLENNKVIAFFTLLIKSIEINLANNNIPKELQENEPKIPGVLLGCLARDNSQIGKNYGEVLLYEAMKHSYIISKIVGIKGMFLEAENDTLCEKFYNKITFLKKVDGRLYYIPTSTLNNIFKDEDFSDYYNFFTKTS